MERHSIDDATAFAMLRDHSRARTANLIDVATAAVDGHRLLPKQPAARTQELDRVPVADARDQQRSYAE